MRSFSLLALAIAVAIVSGCGDPCPSKAQAAGYGYRSYAGSAGYAPSYGYSYASGYYPSYYGYYPSYSYALTPYYQSYYGTQPPAAPAQAQATPEQQGYRYYPEHVDAGKRFPAGWYRLVPSNGLWFRYGAGYEYGTPAGPTDPAPQPPTPPTPIPPPVPEQTPKGPRTMPGAEPSPEELQRLKIMLDMLRRIEKP